MRGKTFDPRHLDVESFAERAGALEGRLPLSGLSRLGESTHPQALHGPSDEVVWRAHGERRGRRGGPDQSWLHLAADCQVQLTCQRCLQAVEVPLVLERSFRFVGDEASAAAADIDAEEDVLASTRSLDLAALIEDELLLALPLVPRHEGRCPQPLVAPVDVQASAMDSAPRDNPFEALAALKSRKVVN